MRTKSPEKTQHLEDLGIEIIDNVELLASDGWDDVTKGCSFVHHCASPFFFAAPGGDPTSGFLTPALEGTKNVVEAAIRSTTVQRIVLTSSCAAVQVPTQCPPEVFPPSLPYVRETPRSSMSLRVAAIAEPVSASMYERPLGVTYYGIVLLSRSLCCSRIQRA